MRCGLVCHGIASCATRHTATRWVWIRLLCAGNGIKSVARLSNSTPKTDRKFVFLRTYAKTSLVRVLSLKLFIHVVPSCAIRWMCLVLLLLPPSPSLLSLTLMLHGRTYTRSRNMQNSCEKCKRPFRVWQWCRRRAYIGPCISTVSFIEFKLQIFLSTKNIQIYSLTHRHTHTLRRLKSLISSQSRK